MNYFNKAFLDFFSGLMKNNSREWFDKNRKVYETEVKNPFKSLVEHMISKIHEHDPEVQIEAKDAIFRINRDIRFSKDKTPYQTHVSANISPGGRKSPHPGFYFQLSAKRLMIGGGVYQLEKDHLYQVRDEILHSPKEFQKLISDKSFKSHFGELKGEKNKILPSPFKEALGEQPLLANKQFYYMTEVSPTKIIQPGLDKLLMDYYLAGKKMNNYFKQAMGN